MDTDQAAESDLPQATDGQASTYRINLQTQVRQLLRDRPTRDEFFERLLLFCRKTFRATLVRIDLSRDDRTESLVSHDDRMPRSLAQRFTTDYLSPFVAELKTDAQAEAKLKRYERGDQKMTLAGVSLVQSSDDQPPAVLTLMLGGTVKADMLLVRLDAIAAVASTLLMTRYAGQNDRSDFASTSAAAETETETDSEAVSSARRNAVLQAAQFGSVREFAYSVVNSLRTELAAEQVFLGIEKNQRIVVEAVSGVADFKASNPGVVMAQQAMDECLDAGETLLYQLDQPTDRSVPTLHRQWSSQTSGAVVCSFPLLDGQEVAGVISIRRPAARPMTAEEIDRLQKVLAAYGSALRVVERASQPLSERLRTSARSVTQQNLRSGSIGRKVLLGILSLALLWFCFGSMTYRPICPVKVTATQLRHLSAPLAARLAAVHVKPGQQVTAGQLLAELDVSDLQLERNSLRRQFAATQTEIRQAVADDDLNRAAVARSQMQVFEARMAALNHRIDDAQIVAPADGTVVLSGLETRIGQTVAQGDELLQFATEGDWRLEIEVPDDIAPLVTSGQVGHFSASARPAERQNFEIQEVDGAASVVQDRNVFIAHARLSSRPNWMRIGMEGTVRINTVSRPVWWVTMHRAIDWARIHFWL